MAPIDFWFSIGSTYTYLAVMRLGEVSAQSGVAFTWRPFSVRAIMREMGNIPFADKPAKLKYMWRDIGRFAAESGLSPKLPAPYPLKEFDMANRVAIVGREEGWCEAYVRAAYRGWFERGEPAGELGVVGFLAGIEPRVLRDGHAAAGKPSGRRHRFCRERFGQEGDRRTQDDLERLDDGCKRERRIGAALGPAEVGEENHACAPLPQIANRGQRRTDAGIVGDLAVLDRHVEVHPDQGAATIQRRRIQLGQTPLHSRAPIYRSRSTQRAE